MARSLSSHDRHFAFFSSNRVRRVILCTREFNNLHSLSCRGRREPTRPAGIKMDRRSGTAATACSNDERRPPLLKLMLIGGGHRRDVAGVLDEELQEDAGARGQELPAGHGGHQPQRAGADPGGEHPAQMSTVQSCGQCKIGQQRQSGAGQRWRRRCPGPEPSGRFARWPSGMAVPSRRLERTRIPGCPVRRTALRWRARCRMRRR